MSIRQLKRLRNWWLRRIKWRKYAIGPGLYVGRGVHLWARNEISIGMNCYIGRHSQIECDVRMGDHVLIANRVAFVGRYDHCYQTVGTPTRSALCIRDAEYRWRGLSSLTVVGDDVWIGYGAVILSGVTIGEGSIVAAGSIVTNDVPPYTIVGGNPARRIGSRFEDDNAVLAHRDALRRMRAER